MNSISSPHHAAARRLPGLLAGACVLFGVVNLCESLLSPAGDGMTPVLWLLGSLVIAALVYFLASEISPTPSRPLIAQGINSSNLRMEVVDTLAQTDDILDSAPHSRPPTPVFPLELLLGLSRSRFEDLCHAYFRAKGIRAEPTSEGPNSGFDIRIFQDTSNRPQVIVQCRAGTDGVVELAHMQQLHELMARERIEKGFFLTRGSFSEEARAFSQNHQIFAIDGKLFVALIDRLPEEARSQLLVLAKAR